MLELKEEGRRAGMGAARTGRGPRLFIVLEGGGGVGAASIAAHEGVSYTE
jgi:hypothetical protein